MPLPTHRNPSKREDTAVAPYNFVPLPEQVISTDVRSLPDQDRYASERFTGVIDCTLTTETPLYTRAALTEIEHERGHSTKKKTDFFYVDPKTKEPVIPGSSIRGMLRNIVEIASQGKIEEVTDQPLFYRAVGDTTSHGEKYRERLMRVDSSAYNNVGKRVLRYTPLVRGGYIRRDTRYNTWYIQPAKEIGGTTFARISHRLLEKIQSQLDPISDFKGASEIYIRPTKYDYQDVRGGFLQVKYARINRAEAKQQPHLQRAALLRSGFIHSKGSEAIIYAEPENPDHQERIQIHDELIEHYRDSLSPEVIRLLGSEGVLVDGHPIFYLLERDKEGYNHLVFFSHTMMMPLPYTQTPRDLIPKHLRELSTPSQVDMAESIFGYTRGKDTPSHIQGKQLAYAGRIFVDNAVLTPEQRTHAGDIWLSDDVTVPKILSSPKPTTFQHYLVQQQSDPQEIGRTRDGRPKYQKFLQDYESSPDKGEVQERTTLRGHKHYWHKGEVTQADIEVSEEVRDVVTGKRSASRNVGTIQYTKIKPVASGVTFQFSIRFENLSQVELGAILWALQLPGEKDKAYRHKLGMGKPLGMGSVRIMPALHLSDRQSRYRTLFEPASGQWHEGWGTETRIELFVQAYEQFILSELTNLERGTASTLHETIRIKTLFAMMEWPGKPKEESRYMEIERINPNARRGRINEYRGRPVLPMPVETAPPEMKGAPEWPDVPQSVTSGDKPESAERAQARADLAAQFMQRLGGSTPRISTETPVSHPQSANEIVVDICLEGKVIRIEPDRVVIDLGIQGVPDATLQKVNIRPPVRDFADLEMRFPEKKKFDNLWVKSINKRGRVQLMMKVLK